jgi:hypothetical protein
MRTFNLRAVLPFATIPFEPILFEPYWSRRNKMDIHVKNKSKHFFYSPVQSKVS